MSGIPRFPELDLRQRPLLFDALQSHSFEGDVVEASFGDRAGWVVIDPAIARGLLRRHDISKGRAAVSRSAVGGYPAQTGADFHRRRSEVIVALARAAADTSALASSLESTIGSMPPLRSEAPAAFTRWMLHDLVGGSVDPVDATALVDGIAAAEALAEAAQSRVALPLGAIQARATLVELLIERVGAAESPFLEELRKRLWPAPEIAEELVGMALAGWESTAAVVTTALTIGLPRDPTEGDVNELLRLYPSSWLIVRVMTGDEPWGSAGDLAVVSPWISQRSPAWRESERFDPTRSGDPAAFPFGAGPRRCPADLYARTQITVALAAFGGHQGRTGHPELLGHRSATLIPDVVRSVP